MIYGLQTSFNEPIGRDRCHALAAMGIQLCRIDAQTCSIDTMLEMVTEVMLEGMAPLVIVADVARLAALPAGIDAEWTNEPDGDVDPRDYRALLDGACEVAASYGIRLWAPAISNLSEPAFKWANAVRDAGGGWPDGLYGVSVHRYGPGGPVETPHSGFASRDNEVGKWLFALCQGKPFLVSEFGHDTAVRTEGEAADRIAWEWRFWDKHGAYAAVLYQINDGSGNDEHSDYGLYRVDGSVKEAIAATIPKPPVPEPEPFPVPPPAHDLNAWPRRGATIAASLLDTRWDLHRWASTLGDIFGGRGLTQVNVLSALWPESAPHMEHPFTQEPDGRWNLTNPNPLFYDRLQRYVEAMNFHGVVVQLCFLELYSWSKRKSGMPFDKDRSPVRHNVNGVEWGLDDLPTMDLLPDAFLTDLVERVVSAVKGAGVCVVPGNEFPEKPIHFKIAEIVKRVDPSMRVVTNRNEDTPGQYFNMEVGQGRIDMIAFHGWKDLRFLSKDWPDEPSKRPRTFQQFFDNVAQDGRWLGVDYSRVICSSDGSRSSDDPIDTYRWDELLGAFRYVADRGGNLEHQSRCKMHAGARLDVLETDFLHQIATL